MIEAKRRTAIAIAFALSLFLALSMTPAMALGKAIKTDSRAEALAKAKVGRTAIVKDVDADYEGGVLYFEVELVKGNKEFDLKYRAKDSKLVEYQWELKRLGNQKRSGRNLSEAWLSNKAANYVQGATIVSAKLDRDDGLTVYKVTLKTASKKHKIEMNAKSGAVLEYEWKEIVNRGSANNSSKYIGSSKATSIAKNYVTKNLVSGAKFKKCKFEKEDGVPTYEVTFVKWGYEYEITVHARTGRILDVDVDD